MRIELDKKIIDARYLKRRKKQTYQKGVNPTDRFLQAKYSCTCFFHHKIELLYFFINVICFLCDVIAFYGMVEEIKDTRLIRS